MINKLFLSRINDKLSTQIGAFKSCRFNNTAVPGLKYPYNVHGNIHDEKSIHVKLLDMVHGYDIDAWKSICIFPING